jgi:hypothetical protein
MSANVKWKKEGNKLVIEVDLNIDLGPTKSGRANMVGSTKGWEHVDNEVAFNLNVTKRER